MTARQQLQKIRPLKSYHYLKNGFDPSITVQAHDINDAVERLNTLYGITPNPSLVVSHEDYVRVRDSWTTPWTPLIKARQS